MHNTLVSVIIPAYNVEYFISGAIQSVINQTYPHWELLVVDDGSTDGTRSVIEKFLVDRRVRYLYQKNKERSAARNRGIKEALGTYIAFLDADDLWMPTKLEIQINVLETRPEVGLCFTNREWVDNQGNRVYAPKMTVPLSGKHFFYLLLRGNFITNSTVVASKSVFDKVGLFDENLPAFGAEDWDMWLRITRYFPIYFIDQPLVLYRVHENNTSLDSMYLSTRAVLGKLFSDPTLPIDIRKGRKQVYARLHFGYAETYLKLGQRKKAFEHWQLALRAYPASPLVVKRGLWSTLKLLLPFSLITRLPKSIIFGSANQGLYFFYLHVMFNRT